MTVDIRPDPLTPLRSAIDPAPWDLTIEATIQGEHITVADPQPVDTQYALDGTVVVQGWTPPPPLPPHHCPDGICADLRYYGACIEQAADWRSYSAWARTMKADIRRAKTARGKRVKALRKQLVGTQP